MTNVIQVNFNQKALNAGLNSISRYEALTNEISHYILAAAIGLSIGINWINF